MAKIWYNKLLVGCLDGSMTINDVPEKYRRQVTAMADRDLAAGKIPQWQYDLMFPVDEGGNE